MSRPATAIEVTYKRDGAWKGDLFFSTPGGGGFQLTTPLLIIDFDRQAAFELYDALIRAGIVRTSASD